MKDQNMKRRMECPSVELKQQIPLDIVEEILVRLPVKSIQKFRLVCKLWCALISDASFAQTHLNFVNKNRHGLTVIELNREIKDSRGRTVGLVGSCSGLVCMHENEKISIFNPSTRKSVSLPDASSGISSIWVESTRWNFGFNPNTNAYTIMDFYDEHCDHYPGCKVEVFTLGKDTSWRQINQGSNWIPSKHAINIGGAMYWKILHKYPIMLFDLEEEKFEEMEAPDGRYEKDNYSRMTLLDLNGHLCYVSVLPDSNQMMNLWTLSEPKKNKYWTHLRAIDLSNLPHYCHPNSICRITRNNIYLVNPDGRGYCLELAEKDDSADILTKSECRDLCWSTVFTYVESLLPLPKISNIS